MVERFIKGTEHRMLVVGGKMVAANMGEAVSVKGDGKSTIDELIDSQINTDPRRGVEHEFPLYVISLDRFPAAKMEVERQGFTGSSVPEKGQEVMIVRTSNMAFDVTDEVHPDTAELACLARASSASTSPASTWSARTSPSRSTCSAAPSSRSTPARAC
jgi:cyanophycin synthetase